jgi:transposase
LCGLPMACDKKLRQAVVDFADDSRHASPWAADIYRRAVDRGCSHPHATASWPAGCG